MVIFINNLTSLILCPFISYNGYIFHHNILAFELKRFEPPLTPGSPPESNWKSGRPRIQKDCGAIPQLLNQGLGFLRPLNFFVGSLALSIRFTPKKHLNS